MPRLNDTSCLCFLTCAIFWKYFSLSWWFYTKFTNQHWLYPFFLNVRTMCLVLLILVLLINFRVHHVCLAVILHTCPQILPLIYKVLFLWNPSRILQLQTHLSHHRCLLLLVWPLPATRWLPEEKLVYSNHGYIMLWMFCLILKLFRHFLLSKNLGVLSLLQNTLNGSRLRIMRFKLWRQMICGFLYLILTITM